MREGNVMPDEDFTELAGPRAVLRRFRPDDVATFVAYRSCEQVARFQSWDAPYPGWQAHTPTTPNELICTLPLKIT
jgi:hypothetical protein